MPGYSKKLISVRKNKEFGVLSTQEFKKEKFEITGDEILQLLDIESGIIDSYDEFDMDQITEPMKYIIGRNNDLRLRLNKVICSIK